MARIVQPTQRARAGSRIRNGVWRILLLYALWLQQGPALAALPPVRFSAERIDYGDLRVSSFQAELEPEGGFKLRFDRLAGPGEQFLGSGLELEGALELSNEAGAGALSGTLLARGLAAAVSLEHAADGFLLRLDALAQPLTALAHWPGMPAAAAWVKSGRFDASVTVGQGAGAGPSVRFRLGADDLAFDSPDGLYAGEALRLEAGGSWPDAAMNTLSLHGAVRAGELLINDFYRDFANAGLDFGSDLRWNDGALELTNLRLGDGDALAVEASARLGTAGDAGDWSLEVRRLELDFPAAYQRYVEPVAAAWTLNGLEMTGRVAWSGEWDRGSLVSGDLEVDDLSIVDTQRQRFAVTGLAAHLRPGDSGFDSRLSWRGLLLGRINAGAGEVALDSEPGSIALIRPLHLDVLGGRIELGALRIVLPGSRADGSGEPDVMLRARIDGLDVGRLTAAMGWPSFEGSVSGEIPGVSLEHGVLTVDGEIVVDVFGGRISLNNLSMERVFGVLPSLAADVRLTDLDLEQLTQTFEFGRIAGRLDGEVRDLRMLDWKPVAFDAWLGTPERQGGSNDISRQAVNHLTTIGGGSATTALTGPLMRMFSSFSYRRIGMGCVLSNNVCQLRGLSEDAASVLLLEGAGVPKITIRAFNRSVDWPQMVSNLLALTDDQAIRVGDRP